MLGEEPDVKEQLFEVLKQYAAERDVETLAEALPDILITEEHQQLIDSVRLVNQRRLLCVYAHVVCVSFREPASLTSPKVLLVVIKEAFPDRREFLILFIPPLSLH